MASPSALRELQRDLETKANDLSKLQKGNQYFQSYPFSFPYQSLPPINPTPLKEFQFPPLSFIYVFVIVFVFVCVCLHVLKLSPLDVLYFFRYCEESPSEKEVHYPARRERARPQGFFLLISFLFFLFG
jgi:hypothetical protein